MRPILRVQQHTPVRWLVRGCAAVLAALLWLGLQPTPAQATPTTPTQITETTATFNGFNTEYDVSGPPRNVALQAPGLAWYTAPTADGIGVVSTTHTLGDPEVRYRAEFYALGPGATPYDLVIHDGIVWFTLRGFGQLGRMDTATRDLTFIDLPNTSHQPTGIAVGGGSLWLGTTNAGLYRFNLTTNTFTHHPFTGITNAAPVEDVLFQDIRTIWFSMPTNYAIGAFNSTRGTYNTTATIARVVDPNDGSTQAILLEPNGLALDPSGQQLWIAGNNPSINGGFGAVGRLITQTWTDLVWYFAPPGSGPYGVVIVNTPNGTETWVTHTTAGNAGRFQFNTNGLLINSETTPRAAAARFFGITQAPNSHIWIADSGRNILVELAPPYIYKLYAALIAN